MNWETTQLNDITFFIVIHSNFNICLEKYRSYTEIVYAEECHYVSSQENY